MGEFADMLIDQMWDLTDEDLADGEEWYGTVGRWNKVCRCCGRGGLVWEMRNDKWRLHDQRGLHACSVNPLREPLAKETKRPLVPEGEWLPPPAGYRVCERRATATPLDEEIPD